MRYNRYIFKNFILVTSNCCSGFMPSTIDFLSQRDLTADSYLFIVAFITLLLYSNLRSILCLLIIVAFQATYFHFMLNTKKFSYNRTLCSPNLAAFLRRTSQPRTASNSKETTCRCISQSPAVHQEPALLKIAVQKQQSINMQLQNKARNLTLLS